MLAVMAELVRLRRLHEDDLGALHAWYQSPELWEHLVGDWRARSEAAAVAYMRRWLAPGPREVRLAVTRASDGVLIGLASLSPIDPEAGEAEFHIFLGDAAERGRGYGRAATSATLEHAFEALRLWRVLLRVLQTNVAALKVYARLGFSPDEAAAPETVVKGGAPVAVIALSLTEAAFRHRQAADAHR